MNSPQPQKNTQLNHTSIFDPDKSFLDLTVVRTTIGIIGMVALLVTAFIAFHMPLTLDLSGDGFNHAVAQFKVPIGILTISIPLLALLAANHRSEQTKKQMILTLSQIERTDRQITMVQGQNIFSNYFKHLEEFDKRFKGKDNDIAMHVTSPYKLHHFLFPNSRHGKLELSKNAISIAEDTATAFIRLCRRFKYEEHWSSSALKIDKKIRLLVERFKISQGSRTGTQILADGESFMLTGGQLGSFLVHNILIFRYLDDILSFDEKYLTPPNLKHIVDLDMSKIPYDYKEEKTFIPFDIEEILGLSNPDNL